MERHRSAGPNGAAAGRLAGVSEAVQLLGWEDFLELEAHGLRHELVGGRAFAMAGGSERHDLLAGLIGLELATATRAGPCRTFTQNRLVRTPRGDAYYPDVLLVCGPAAHRLYETDADVIVEVLSDSTENVDRREKARAYAELASLRSYVLVDPRVRRVEVGRRRLDGGWDWDVVPAGGLIDLGGQALVDRDALYDELERKATTD
jgi:Uma2 family endonuclease